MGSSMSALKTTKRQHDKARVKILIADCEGVFRLGLKKLFSVEDDLRVVAQAENASQLLAMAKAFRPDVAIVQQEIALNGSSKLLQQIRSESPRCKVVITCSQLTDTEREELFREGTWGVITRSARPELFVENVRRVVRGETIQRQCQEDAPGRNGEPAAHRLRPIDTLTPRERAIISCLTQGWRNRDIAQHLTITEQTVKNHLRSVYDKVGVSDRLELVLYAIHQRLKLPPVNS